MKPILVTRSMQAPPDLVWAAITDIEHAADLLSGIKACTVLTDGPVGVGTRFRETRVMFGKEATEEMEIVAFDPPRMYAVEADSCGARFHSELRIVPEDGGCRLEMEFRSTPLTTMAKLMSPLGKLFAGAMVKCLRTDLEDIARGVESGSDGATKRRSDGAGGSDGATERRSDEGGESRLPGG